MIQYEWRGTRFIGESRVFWRVMNYYMMSCLCCLLWMSAAGFVFFWFAFERDFMHAWCPVSVCISTFFEMLSHLSSFNERFWAGGNLLLNCAPLEVSALSTFVALFLWESLLLNYVGWMRLLKWWLFCWWWNLQRSVSKTFYFFYFLFFQCIYISNGSCPPIGSDEEDVVELARDLVSCFCILLNFWNFKNCWNSSSESDSSWIGTEVLWVDLGVIGEFAFLATWWIWWWSFFSLCWWIQ